MPVPNESRRYRFGLFEADALTGELRKQGVRIRLHDQPFQLLLLLLARPGELLTRDEIAGKLWTAGTFVDVDHGLNSAINRIRDALGDTARNPRFVETVARRGYRFIAPVQLLPPARAATAEPALTQDAAPAPAPTPDHTPQAEPTASFLAAPEDLPETTHRTVQTLFLLLQLMHLSFYVGALANLTEIEDLLAPLPPGWHTYWVLVVTAAMLIPLRAFLISAALFRPPTARTQLLNLWPLVLAFDILWSLAPFLLLHHISFGLALSCTALLVYSPFAQRSLILMGAAQSAPKQAG